MEINIQTMNAVVITVFAKGFPVTSEPKNQRQQNIFSTSQRPLIFVFGSEKSTSILFLESKSFANRRPVAGKLKCQRAARVFWMGTSVKRSRGLVHLLGNSDYESGLNDVNELPPVVSD